MEEWHVVDERRPSLSYVPGLDGLRALAVVAVMFFHADVRSVSGGFLGVDVFFVISGYLITSLLLSERRRTGHTGLRTFYVRRARRLLPALFLMLAVTTIFTLLFLPDAAFRLRSDLLPSIFYFNNWHQIWSHQSYLAEAGRPPLLRHLWSLSIEEQFYVVWPLVFVAAAWFKVPRRWLTIGALAGAFVSLSLMWALYDHTTSRAYYGTDTHSSGLLIGVALAFLWAPDRLRGQAGRGAGFVVDAAGVLGLLVMFRFFHEVNAFEDYIYSWFRLGVVNLAAALVIAAVVHPHAHLGRLLGAQPLRWIGLRSYGIYLWHWPIFMVTRPTLDVPLHGWPLLVLRFALSFAAADLSYRYVEQPIRHGAVGRYLSALRREHGEHRLRLVRRGVVFATSGMLVVAGLAAGLSTVREHVERVTGIDQAGATGDDAAPDQPVISLPSTTAPGPTTVPRRGGSGPTTTTTVPVSPHAPPVLAIGDSVMLGARSALEQAIPGIVVDARVSRQFSHAITVLQLYRAAGYIGPVVLVHLGTNGVFSDAQFDQMMQLISPSRAIFVNSRVPRGWEPFVNDHLRAGVARWPNATLVDWHAIGGPHADFFARDGFHLTAVGARYYAALLKSALY
jgi:peptidoglycan/LPS O-acetylase OafA/YrhL